MTHVRCPATAWSAVLLDGERLRASPVEVRHDVAAAGAALLRLRCRVLVIDPGTQRLRGISLPSAPSLESAAADLHAAGIGPGLTVLIADAHSRMGRRAASTPRLTRVPFRAAVPLLRATVTARRTRRVPDIDEDPAWLVRRPHDELLRRVDEAVLTVGAGGFATRGSVEEAIATGAPAVLSAGVYRGVGADETLAPGPLWTALTLIDPPAEDERILDLRTGLLVRRETRPAGLPLRTARFASAAAPGVVALRAEADVDRIVPGPALTGQRTRILHGAALSVAVDGGTTSVAAAARQRRTHDGTVASVERVAAYATAPHPEAAVGRACLAVQRAGDFDDLLNRHRQAWAERWRVVDVRIPDDPELQLAVRYALFQLQCNTDRHDELAVGARGLSGYGYRGHVFWDADVYVLPALASIDPAAARAMVEYRLQRLPAARRRAAAAARHGARFPWESAATGEDVTPDTTTVADRLVQVATGEQEEHITADVAWGAAHYLSWTGDRAASAALTPLLTETAAYWADRLALDADGRAHITGVIGPDEYHPNVDDNAYTNLMAAWNLRRGAAALIAARSEGSKDTARRWRQLADALVTGFDPATCRHEQFAGYNRLQNVLITDVADPPVAADVLLGDCVAATQLVKQPDVLMAHHLFPHTMPPGSLRADLDFYLPRTAHGSSLSPAVVAALLAHAGRPDEALPLLAQAARLDLDDVGGTTAGGLHIAAQAGTWLAVLTGICGVAVVDGVLVVEPHLPCAWSSVEVRFRCLGRAITLRIDHRSVRIRTNRPLRARVGRRLAIGVVGEAVAPYRDRPEGEPT